jgi:hypothetical protein
MKLSKFGNYGGYFANEKLSVHAVTHYRKNGVKPLPSGVGI